jgi:molybdopterin synthase catalytic subunit
MYNEQDAEAAYAMQCEAEYQADQDAMLAYEEHRQMMRQEAMRWIEQYQDQIAVHQDAINHLTERIYELSQDL